MTARRILVVLFAALACVGTSFATELRRPTPVAAMDAGATAQWAFSLGSGTRAGQWRLRATEGDVDFPGQRHQRYAQTVNGVPIFGAEVVQQIDERGTTRTVFGALFEGLTLDTTPKLSPDEARHVVDAAVGKSGQAAGQPQLVVLPLDDGVFLTYTLWGRRFSPPSLVRYFVDAHSGAIVFAYQDLKRETPVIGIGTGAWGDLKKMSTQDYGSAGFLAEDRLRPAQITTYDIKFGNDFNPGQGQASDVDNHWTDGMVVDAHNYAGITYDYYYQRQGRKGIDDNNMPIQSLVHVWDSGDPAFNAFWTDELDAMIYGDGGLAPWGVRYAPFSAALDVAAHEMTHGVTSRTWNGIYLSESGALNEAFSDIMGTSVEFFAQPAGSGRLMADYWLGEDLSDPFNPARYAFRSMANPSLFCHGYPFNICDPDNYSVRYRGPLDDDHDNGGVHINSGIANQAFYLLIEGGRNRSSGLSVTGLGSANRAKAEKIFFRGFTLYLTPSATFSDARRATTQAATDLYGASSNEAQQVQAAWTAVGVH
jgi:bacillolysin